MAFGHPNLEVYSPRISFTGLDGNLTYECCRERARGTEQRRSPLRHPCTAARPFLKSSPLFVSFNWLCWRFNIKTNCLLIWNYLNFSLEWPFNEKHYLISMLNFVGKDHCKSNLIFITIKSCVKSVFQTVDACKSNSISSLLNSKYNYSLIN